MQGANGWASLYVCARIGQAARTISSGHRVFYDVIACLLAVLIGSGQGVRTPRFERGVSL